MRREGGSRKSRKRGGAEKATIFNSLCHFDIKLKSNCLHSHRIKSCDTERLLDPLAKDDSANNQNSPAACPGMFQHTSAASKQATETLYSGIVWLGYPFKSPSDVIIVCGSQRKVSFEYRKPVIIITILYWTEAVWGLHTRFFNFFNPSKGTRNELSWCWVIHSSSPPHPYNNSTLLPKTTLSAKCVLLCQSYRHRLRLTGR